MPTVLATPSIAATRLISALVAALLALAIVALGVNVVADGDGFGHGFGIGERSPSSANSFPTAALVDAPRPPFTAFDVPPAPLPGTDQPATPIAGTTLGPGLDLVGTAPVASSPIPAPAREPGPANEVVPPSAVVAFTPPPDPLARGHNARDNRMDAEVAGPLRTMPAKSIPSFDHFEVAGTGGAPLDGYPGGADSGFTVRIARLSDWFSTTTGEILGADEIFHAGGSVHGAEA